MRTAVLRVGGAPPLRVWVAETLEEQRRGLQGFAPLGDGEGMYFPCRDVMSIAMLSVGFPIDILSFDWRSRLAQIVDVVQPGDARVWSFGCSGVLEVRGGWARTYGVQIGDPLVASL